MIPFLRKYLWAVVLAAVLLVVGLWWAAAERVDDQQNQEQGARAQREVDLRETVVRVQEAEDVRKEIASPSSQLAYAQCLRTARTPENCERFLPSGQAD